MRTYKRKRPVRPWRDRDKRMQLAARLDGEGLSLREIAVRLAVGKTTVARDLERWAATRPNVTPLVSRPAVPTDPARGETGHPGGTVIPLRRTS